MAQVKSWARRCLAQLLTFLSNPAINKTRNQHGAGIGEVHMDGLTAFWLIVSSHEKIFWAIVFWIILLGQMIGFTYAFCDMNKREDYYVKKFRSQFTNVLVTIGFLSMGMPVLQSGLWLDGEMQGAWTAVLAMPFLLVVLS